jgi:hypothetical protein
VRPEGFGPHSLPSHVDQLLDPDAYAEILLTWIYAGMTIHPLHKLLRFQDERNQRIVERYEASESRASIAAAYGLSERRVGYIIQRAKDNES